MDSIKVIEALFDNHQFLREFSCNYILNIEKASVRRWASTTSLRELD